MSYKNGALPNWTILIGTGANSNGVNCEEGRIYCNGVVDQVCDNFTGPNFTNYFLFCSDDCWDIPNSTLTNYYSTDGVNWTYDSSFNTPYSYGWVWQSINWSGFPNQHFWMKTIWEIDVSTYEKIWHVNKPAGATGSQNIKVVESVGLTPISGVSVLINGINKTTDGNGWCGTWSLSSGQNYPVTISKSGYKTLNTSVVGPGSGFTITTTFKLDLAHSYSCFGTNQCNINDGCSGSNCYFDDPTCGGNYCAAPPPPKYRCEVINGVNTCIEDPDGNLDNCNTCTNPPPPPPPPPATVTWTIGVSSGIGSVRVTKNGVIIDTISTSKAYILNDSDTIELLAIPNSGYIFQNFCDIRNVCTTGNPGIWGVVTEFGDDVRYANFLQQSNAVNLTLNRGAGDGKVNVYKNSGYLGQLGESDSSKLFQFAKNDECRLESIPAAGSTFVKYSINGQETTLDPYAFIITGATSASVYFSTSHNICETGSDGTIGVCKRIPGAGIDECTVIGNTCPPTKHNECFNFTCQRKDNVSGGDNRDKCATTGEICIPEFGCAIKNPASITGECLVTWLMVGIAVVILIFIVTLIK